MSSDKQNVSTTPHNLASLIRGLYGRVARRLKVDPSYVSRVARGERRSSSIEETLESELRRIMTLVGANYNHNGAGRNGASHHTNRPAKKKARAKRKTKTLQ